jgi:hypothetical protein
MKKRLNLYQSIPIEKIIQSNLSVQSIQRSLTKDFGVKNPNYSSLVNFNFLKIYDSWGEEKRNKFIKTIGGVVYFSKIKNFLQKLEREKLEFKI